MDWCETLHTRETDVENNSLPRKKNTCTYLLRFFFFPNSDSLSASLIVPEHEGGTVLPRYFFPVRTYFPECKVNLYTHTFILYSQLCRRGRKECFPLFLFLCVRWCLGGRWQYAYPLSERRRKNNKRSQPHWSCRNVQKAIPYNPRPWRVV